MSNLDAALALADAGIPVFPCQTAGMDSDGEPLRKKPCPGVMWTAQATSRRASVEAFWRRWPNAAPGVHIGKTPWFVIDCDAPKQEGQAHGIEWFRQACFEHDYDIEAIPIVKTPSGGWHCYFRRPAGVDLGNGRGSIPPKEESGIDLRGIGGYVLGPGSEIDIGRYEMLDGPEISAAPDLPPWLLEILTARRVERVIPPTPVARPSQPGTREEAYARAALEEEARVLAGTPPGARNTTLNECAFKVGTVVGAGWLSAAEARAALTAAVAGWKDPKKTLGTLERGLAAGMAHPRAALEPVEDAATAERREDLARQLDAIGADPESEVDAEPVVELADCPDALLRPPGLVGEIADWIEATSPRPVRLFAVAAALVTIGALVARQVYTGTPRTGTHLYCLLIAGTGGGKDRPQEAVGQILEAVGRSAMVRGAFSSAASLGMWLGRQPAQVQIIDEIASVLRKLNNAKSSNSEASMLEAYCSIWGRNAGDFRTDTTTMRDGEAIHRPWVSILGATTPAAFREQMKSRNVANGFLNRFLVLPRHVRGEWREDVLPADEVPADLVARCLGLMCFDDERHQFAQSALYASNITLPTMITVPTTPDADVLLRAARLQQEDMLRRSDDDPLFEIWSRSAEMIRRVALILACGRHPSSMIACRIEADDVDWATDFVTWAMDGFVEELRQNMADTQHQADMLHVLGIIRKARLITRRNLYQRLKGRYNKMTMDSILDTLKAGGSIDQRKARHGERGREAVEYVFLRG